VAGKNEPKTEEVPARPHASRDTVPLPANTVPIDRGSRPVTFPYSPGDPILPGYRLVKPLGRGGFGEVWLADAPGGMSVAIKVLANVGRREGTREYRALQTIKNIRHAHIVPVFGVWLKSSDGTCLGEADVAEASRRILAAGGAVANDASEQAPLELIVAMGLGDGTLHDRLQEALRSGATGLPQAELLDWMRQAALALDHFNAGARTAAGGAAAVQHCDIKPQNILLVGDVVQVCDFGLARSQGEVRATSNNMASLAYAPPEMLKPPYDPSATTDQYALAISYHELRTGRLPYRDATMVGVLNEKLSGALDLAAVAPAEQEVLTRALDRDPANRFPSCIAFVRALAAAVGPLQESEHGTAAGTSTATDRTQADTTKVMVQQAPAGGVDGSDRKPRGRWVLPAAIGAVVSVAALWRMADSPDVPADPDEHHVEEPSSQDGIPPDRQEVRDDAAGTQRPAASAMARGEALENEGNLVAAAAAYAAEPSISPDRLASILWDLHTLASDAGRPHDSLPILDRLERLYGGAVAPQVEGIGRWDVVNALAWYLATLPEGSDAPRARILAEEGMTLAGDDHLERAQSLDTLAAALARDGDFTAALERIVEAISLATTPAMVADFEARREAYASGVAWTKP